MKVYIPKANRSNDYKFTALYHGPVSKDQVTQFSGREKQLTEFLDLKKHKC